MARCPHSAHNGAHNGAHNNDATASESYTGGTLRMQPQLISTKPSTGASAQAAGHSTSLGWARAPRKGGRACRCRR